MTRADYLAVLFTLVLLPLLYFQFCQSASPANRVTLVDHQNEKQSYTLPQNRFIQLQGKLGNTRLQIKDNKVRFVNSPCKGKYCIHHGWLQHSGAVMACLPNGVFVQLAGNDPRYDAINF